MALMHSGPKPESTDSGTVNVLPQRPHFPQWQSTHLRRQRASRAQLAEQPVERPGARRILRDAGAPPVPVMMRVEHGAQKRVAAFIVGPVSTLTKCGLVSSGLLTLKVKRLPVSVFWTVNSALPARMN